MALPLVNEIYEQVIKAGGNPNVLIGDDQLQESKFLFANEEQLNWNSPISRLINEKADALIHIAAPSNTRSLNGVDPKKQQSAAAAHQEVTQIFRERSAAKEVRWVISNYPCQAYAQEADMSLRDYADFVYQATFADQDDPVGAWQKIHDEQQRLVDWLVGKQQVMVKGPNVDLRLSVEGRTFINADGRRTCPAAKSSPLRWRNPPKE